MDDENMLQSLIDAAFPDAAASEEVVMDNTAPVTEDAPFFEDQNEGPDNLETEGVADDTQPWAAQIAELQQQLQQVTALPNELAGIRQLIERTQKESQQTTNQFVQMLAAAQQAQEQKLSAERAQQEKAALVNAIQDLDPNEALLRVLAYVDQKEQSRDQQLRTQQQNLSQFFAQQEAARREDEARRQTAFLFQQQYGLNDEERESLMPINDAYTMQATAQWIATQRRTAELERQNKALLATLAARQRVAGGADRVGNANGSPRGLRTAADARNDSELLDWVIDGVIGQ